MSSQSTDSTGFRKSTTAALAEGRAVVTAAVGLIPVTLSPTPDLDETVWADAEIEHAIKADTAIA